ncbi:hypothetical protein [Bradyrhizobium sp. CCBAU 53340]|uniref:hypothetical protein n=1 Tax=Bradyrhizobium sp. CCBAU 53340 TaxID=1325112 RepID=UPI0035303142
MGLSVGPDALIFCEAPFAGADGSIIRPDCPAKSQTIALSSMTVKHRASTRQFNLRSCDNKCACKPSKREGRFAVEKVRRLRAMSSLCRQQAAYNSMNKWKLLAEAEYWDHLAELELSSYFQQCNAVTSNEIERTQGTTNANDTGRKTISAV